jgi:hypothetical protein
MDAKVMPRKVLELAAALAKARQAAEAIPVEDMKGTGNEDSAEVKLLAWRREHVEAAAKIAGLRCFKWAAGRWHFGGWDHGQGLNRTMKVEAFVESMNVQGFAAKPYYMMD